MASSPNLSNGMTAMRAINNSSSISRVNPAKSWKRTVTSINLITKNLIIFCATCIIISHLLFCCKFPQPAEFLSMVNNRVFHSSTSASADFDAGTMSQQQSLPYYSLAKLYTRSGDPGKFWTTYKVPEFPAEDSNSSSVKPGQIYLFHGSGQLELTRMTACALESYAFNNFNRYIYLFVNQEYLAWKRLYADVLMSMPNLKVFQTPSLESIANISGEGNLNDVINLATLKSIMKQDEEIKHIFPGSSTVLRWAFLYAFGGFAAKFDDEWIPTRQFGKEFTNFVACRTTNASCHLAGDYPVGFQKKHDFLAHFLQRMQTKEDSRSLDNGTESSFETSWSMEDLLLKACQDKIKAGKYTDLKNCSESMSVLVLFAAKALFSINEHNKKDFFRDDRALIGLKALGSTASAGAQFLSCEHQQCEKHVGAVTGGCHAVTRFMGNNCPKIRRVVELESLCDDPWGILKKYVDVDQALPFCKHGPVPRSYMMTG